MKKHLKTQLLIGLGLILLSIALHYVHVLIFKDAHHTMIFLVADIAFVPLEVFFVTMVLDKILEKREKAHMVEKINMLIRLFYTKLGQELLNMFVETDNSVEEVRNRCQVNLETYEMDFRSAKEAIMDHKHRVDIKAIDLGHLKTMLDEQESLLVNMISSPVLIEYDSFSDLLLSLFHLREELNMKKISVDQSKMKPHQLDHIRVDINRAYRHLALEWVDYMMYLKDHYPFLYVTAIMKNPYDKRDLDTIEEEIMRSYSQSR